MVGVDLSGKGFVESAESADAYTLDLNIVDPIELIEDELVNSFVGVKRMIAGNELLETGEKVELVLNYTCFLELIEDEGH